MKRFQNIAILSFKNKFLQPWLNDYKQFIYKDKLDSSTDYDLNAGFRSCCKRVWFK